MKRYLENQIVTDLQNKLVLVSGPRQVGKTTLAKSLQDAKSTYLNFDIVEDRSVILKRQWPLNTSLLILDEIHKMKKWKSYLKGIYDSEKHPRILVTGSARMDTFRKSGDSLAGRHFLYRLHPLSVRELKNSMTPNEALDSVLKFGGFPEPLLSQNEVSAARWRRSHIDRILKDDLMEIHPIRQLKQIEILTDLLAERVGSPVSLSSLARDLEVSPHTVKSWIQILESLFVIFIVTPYSKNIAKAILKEPKIYFYDVGRVTAKGGARLENAVACALLKNNQFLEDTLGEKNALHYVRNKDKLEADFLTLRNQKPDKLVEVKEGDSAVPNALKLFSEHIKPAETILAVKNLERKLGAKSVQILPLANWLATLEA